jgi:hypothetical protein
MKYQFRTSSLCSRQEHDPHTARGDSLLRWPLRLFPTWVPLLCRWYATFRSFRGHIHIQFAKEGARVDLGPSVQIRDGCYQAHTRTLARAEGIEKLQASYLWVEIGDLHIFLKGFEAEEGYSKTDCLRQHSSSSRNVHA